MYRISYLAPRILLPSPLLLSKGEGPGVRFFRYAAILALIVRILCIHNVSFVAGGVKN